MWLFFIFFPVILFLYFFPSTVHLIVVWYMHSISGLDLSNNAKKKKKKKCRKVGKCILSHVGTLMHPHRMTFFSVTDHRSDALRHGQFTGSEETVFSSVYDSVESL